MVAGRITERDKEQQRPGSSGTTASGSASAPVSVTAISSTSFFDSPHFSRRQHYKMPVPVSSDGQPSEHGDAPPRGYRQPPPGYSAHYSPYGYPPGGHHYPPHGYSPHHGGPPGYPHHPHSHPSAYSPPPGYPGRSIYYGGSYEGGSGTPPGYAMQQTRDGRSSKTPPFQRGRGSGDSVTGGRSTASGSQRASPLSGARREGTAKSSPEQAAPSAQDTSKQPGADTAASTTAAAAGNPQRSSPTKLIDDIETERLRQAALTEISPSQVAPIKTAFHFFVTDMRDSMRPMAEEEVRRSISAAPGEPIDPYLVNSNLNCRLIKAWEDLNDERRQACQRREEEDRRRFMEEEEIASRHCATLTARSKSPKTPERRNSSHTADRNTPNPSPTSLATATTNPEPSPSPISRLSVAHSGSMDNDEKKVDDSSIPAPSAVKSGGPKDRIEDDGANKRPSPSKQDEKGGSPPKRNRLEDDIKAEQNTAAKS